MFEVGSTSPPAPAITVIVATAMNRLYGCLIIEKSPPLYVVVRSSEIELDFVKKLIQKKSKKFQKTIGDLKYLSFIDKVR